MFHFNTETRTTYYHHEVEGEGLDHCFDCMSEIFILRTWFQKHRGVLDEKELDRLVAVMSSDLSRRISTSGRTLVLPPLELR